MPLDPLDPLLVYHQFSDYFDHYTTFLRFFHYLVRLRPHILQSSPKGDSHPLPLPSPVSSFLCERLHLSPHLVACVWAVLSPTIHEWVELDYSKDTDDVFRVHGRTFALGAETFIPPVKRCIRSECPALHGGLLSNEIIVEARLFTIRRGAVPVRYHSLYCYDCSTRYWPDYFVHEASGSDAVRQYYKIESMPSILHLHETVFVDEDLCNYIRHCTAIGQLSATRFAQLYNSGVGATPSDPPTDSLLLQALTYEMVLDSFFLYSLLLDYHTRRKLPSDKPFPPFCLPHGGEQDKRYDTLLEARNTRFSNNGRKAWTHACSDCFKVFTKPDGSRMYISAVVTDGVTVGHPCCAEHNCPVDLADARDRYCPLHKSKSMSCAVAGCSRAADPQFVSCDNPVHRKWELDRRSGGEAFSVLRRRHKTAWSKKDIPKKPSAKSKPSTLANPPGTITSCPAPLSCTSLSEDTPFPPPPPPPPPPLTSVVEQDHPPPLEEITDDEDDDPSPSLPTQQILKGQIYRQWSHNEQLVVCPCGIIKARASFFGAEGQEAVVVFLQSVFPPEYPGSLPCYIVYDNACQILIHLQASDNNYFQDCAWVVDVFHAYEKHKEDHNFCQKYTNPAGFPDLIDTNQDWLFNSSACEQTNAWYGRFQSLVREMRRVKYNFLLDEVIDIRNEEVTKRLERNHKFPYNQPLEFLLTKRKRATLDDPL